MRPIGNRSSVEDAIAQLNAELTAGTWRPGERIPTEHRLSDELGVSRTVVREAVRSLVQLGVLETRQGAGTFVLTDVDPSRMLSAVRRASMRDVFETQLGLDEQAARLAACRRDDADLERLTTLLSRRDAAHSAEEFGAEDTAFHLAIVETARNPALLEVYRYFAGRLREQLASLRERAEAGGPVVEAGPEAHGALVAAIRERDPDAAAAAARAVIAPSLAFLDGADPAPEPATEPEPTTEPGGDTR